MTVYAGENKYNGSAASGIKWSRLMADTIEELHEMAEKLELPRRWFIADPCLPRYEVSQQIKQKAVDLGAKVVPDSYLHTLYVEGWVFEDSVCKSRAHTTREHGVVSQDGNGGHRCSNCLSRALPVRKGAVGARPYWRQIDTENPKQGRDLASLFKESEITNIELALANSISLKDGREFEAVWREIVTAIRDIRGEY